MPATHPGTLMSVTPEMLPAIIPTATSGHGARRWARKKASLEVASVQRVPHRDTPIKRIK